MLNYSETVHWLFSQLSSYQREGKLAYKNDLSRILEMMNVLDKPQHQFKSIHIAGTNGKGSCSHLIASVFQEQGYRVGLYTSPHLKDFRERIKINGSMISESAVIDFVENNKKHFKHIGLSFFEMTTAMAFEYFANQNIDIAIIETGLGGRLDATNIIDPELCIITNVGLDHEDLLGKGIKKIAYEKAGIIKPNTPLVVGTTCDVSKKIIDSVALVTGATVYDSNEKTHWKSGLKGWCQSQNTATVVKAIEVLRKKEWAISDVILEHGLQKVVENTRLRGRWEQLSDQPIVMCDTGHNSAAFELIVAQLTSRSYKNLWMVLGMVNDKDVDGILALLPKDANYIFCEAPIPRAMPAKDLAHLAAKHQLKGCVVESPQEALWQAKESASEKDFIFVGGSTFVVAEVL